jgi:hypothetical protein
MNLTGQVLWNFHVIVVCARAIIGNPIAAAPEAAAAPMNRRRDGRDAGPLPADCRGSWCVIALSPLEVLGRLAVSVLETGSRAAALQLPFPFTILA